MTQKTGNRPAEPPGGGRQDHDVMRDASMRLVTGGSTDTLAALGGLEVPGRDPHATSAIAAHLPHTGESSMIPGERDPSTLTHREAGAVSGQFAGADIPAEVRAETLDERTARERAREGGGADGERAFGSHR